MRAFRAVSIPLAVACLLTAGCVGLEPRSDTLVTLDHFVPHVSTVPANAGQRVGIYVRQKARLHTIEAQKKGGTAAPVVLFVHGATVPSVPDYDLNYKTYNWMEYLARAGFNVYAMDLTGYGGSPRPMMDDPCNVNPKQQEIIIGRPLAAACQPNYRHQLTTIGTDWDEMNAVVDHLRQVNGVARIHMVGWSAGGPRVGGYVAQHPQKVDRVVLYAPSPTIAKLQIPQQPATGFPVSLQTREDMENKRWDPDVRCPGQVEPGVRDAVWKAIMEWDRIGASWGPSEGVMRGRTATRFGWTPELAAKITAPTLVMVGEYDRLNERRTVFEQISSNDKVFLNIACASHFMVWEKQHRVLHIASLEWLMHGQVKNARRGEFIVDVDGDFKAVQSAALAK